MRNPAVAVLAIVLPVGRLAPRMLGRPWQCRSMQ